MGQISGVDHCNPNEEVNRLARELTRRAADNDAYEGERYEDLSCKDQALTYHEITSHYRVLRRTFPAPHPKLNEAQALTLRRLQTRTYITPSTLHRVDPDTPPTCSLCDHPYCNFEHMLWLCPTHSTTQLSTQEAWQAVITSNDYNIQLQAVQRARDIATSLRLPAPEGMSVSSTKSDWKK
ncbi:hypothetical protein HPB50_024467 [Hyalomma asiaticum]|uniref:Uncharacterized protein n=1 Tax=Hyalomma asiaticum TaxID=266040 RepID=A0ACB7SE83_HYAAI|nr:hypothetical protein HPB50_024467 [Hyalomma asiaticum]